MFVLCDPVYCSAYVASHARFICARERRLHEVRISSQVTTKSSSPNWKKQRNNSNDLLDNDPSSANSNSILRHVVFIMHLPPGISNRMREFALDFNAPWSYAFVDDLRTAEEIGGPPLFDLLQKPIFTLCESNSINVDKIMLLNFQRALSQCLLSPPVDPEEERQLVSYVKMIRNFMSIPILMNFLRTSVMECLKRQAPP